MSLEQLEFSIDWLETKIKELEKNYKEKHKEDFNYFKMKEYVSKKLRKVTTLLAFCSIKPSFDAMSLERFKY